MAATLHISLWGAIDGNSFGFQISTETIEPNSLMQETLRRWASRQTILSFFSPKLPRAPLRSIWFGTTAAGFGNCLGPAFQYLGLSGRRIRRPFTSVPTRKT